MNYKYIILVLLAIYGVKISCGNKSSLLRTATQEELNKLLIESVEDQKLDKALLRYGADINATINDYDTPLIKAVARGNIKLVQQMIIHGADINKATKNGNSALAQACYSGHLDIVHLLVSYKADMSSGLPLCYAACQGHSKVVLALLDAGADPNKCTLQEGCPLTRAASKKGYTDIVSMLIDAGANVDLFCFAKHIAPTALMEAAYQGNLDQVKTLIKGGANVSCRDSSNRTALNYALSRKQEKLDAEDDMKSYIRLIGSRDITSYDDIVALLKHITNINSNFTAIYDHAIDLDAFEIILCNIINSRRGKQFFQALNNYIMQQDLESSNFYDGTMLLGKRHIITVLEKYYNNKLDHGVLESILLGNKKGYIKSQEGQVYDLAKNMQLKYIVCLLRKGALISHLCKTNNLGNDMADHIVTYISM